MASLVTDDTVGGMEVEFEEDIVPHDTPCTADVIDIDFSPKTNIYAAGLINGTVEFYQYSSGMQATCVTTLQHHTQSCRNVRFCSNSNNRQGHLFEKFSTARSLDLRRGLFCHFLFSNIFRNFSYTNSSTILN